MKIVFIGANNPETGRMIHAIRRHDHEFSVLGFLDNDHKKHGTVFCDFPVIGGFEILDTLVANQDLRFVNLITRDCSTRYSTSHRVASAGGKFANFLHPNVDLFGVSLGVGNYLQESVIVQSGVSVGNNSSIHMGSLIGHETSIGNSVFIAHGCNLSGCISVEDGVFMGAGVTIVPRVRIGRWSVLGAGSVVLRDVPPYSVVVGNPGRVIKTVDCQWESGDILNV